MFELSTQRTVSYFYYLCSLELICTLLMLSISHTVYTLSHLKHKPQHEDFIVSSTTELKMFSDFTLQNQSTESYGTAALLSVCECRTKAEREGLGWRE